MCTDNNDLEQTFSFSPVQTRLLFFQLLNKNLSQVGYRIYNNTATYIHTYIYNALSILDIRLYNDKNNQEIVNATSVRGKGKQNDVFCSAVVRVYPSFKVDHVNIQLPVRCCHASATDDVHYRPFSAPPATYSTKATQTTSYSLAPARLPSTPCSGFAL